jgi:hypothetical protein
VERLLRVFFLTVLVGPLTYVVDRFLFNWPILTVFWLLYSIPYTDLSEQNGGKVGLNSLSRDWMACMQELARLTLTLIASSDATAAKVPDVEPSAEVLLIGPSADVSA